MIVDIPKPDDFIESGKAQLDFSWDIVLGFLTEYDELDIYTENSEKDDDYWITAKQRIHTAIAILQQGIELILKGKIAEISPYLLISGSPSEWPSPNKTISFTDFRTIDAQDLIKVLNTFSKNPLLSEFVVEFNKLRKLRNSITHSVNKNLHITANDAITTLLNMHKLLFPSESWVSVRKEYLLNYPSIHITVSEHLYSKLAAEFGFILRVLKPSLAKKFLGINKKQRLYICPECQFKCERYSCFHPRYAVLEPNKPSSSDLHCCVCETFQPVERRDCSNIECNGNVISTEYLTCCTCGEVVANK